MIEISELKPHPSPYPEQLSTLAADAKNDPAAFAGLYDYFVQPVYRYIRSRVETNAEAEDLTSQTFIAAFEGLRSYRERGYFSAWLFRIARSKLMDHFRKKRYEVSLESAENASGHEDALEQAVQNEMVRKLMRLIQNRRDDERELIRLRYVAELSFAEMAQVLGKSENAVKKSLYRLLANLKSQME